MREAYYEESAVSSRSVQEARLYNVFKVVAILLFVGVGFFLSGAAAIVPGILASTKNADTGEVNVAARVVGFVEYFGFAALMLCAGIILFRMKNRFNRSFDYTFVEDELRVAKVFNGKRRKFYKTLKADQMLKIGRCDGEGDGFERTCAGMDRKRIILLTPNKTPCENKEFFYILYSSTIEKNVYVVEARKELIDYIVRAAGRNKWDPK